MLLKMNCFHLCKISTTRGYYDTLILFW